MKLLFNNDQKGQEEIKVVLGFLDGGFTYKNLEPDIKLNTPYLIDLVGREVYDKIADHITSPVTDPVEEKERLDDALLCARTYVLSMAYLDFAPDNDIKHSNSGRSFSTQENEKIPWQWQVENSNSSIKRRAFRALDKLMATLDSSGWNEWTASDQFKRANDIFLKNTLEFDKVYPIDRSGQLYYRLVPFMEDFELDRIKPLLTPTVFDALKAKEDPNEEEKKLIGYIQKAVAYLSLGKAMKAFPVEMMPNGLKFNEDSKAKSESRAETMQFLNAEGEKYLGRLQYELDQQNLIYEQQDPMSGLDDDEKFVSL